MSVAFPATPLTKARARFCISADHTKEQLDKVSISHFASLTSLHYEFHGSLLSVSLINYRCWKCVLKWEM